MKKNAAQFSLFDFPGQTASVETGHLAAEGELTEGRVKLTIQESTAREIELLRKAVRAASKKATWRNAPWEIVQRLKPVYFFKWLAGRDRDSASQETDPWMREFYLSRAKNYEEDANV